LTCDRDGYRQARSIHSFFPRNRTHIGANDDGGGDGDDLWKCIVLGNSVGHDAHDWKLTDEDGKKKDALCCASAALLLLYLTKIGSRPKTMKLYNWISQGSMSFPKEHKIRIGRLSEAATHLSPIVIL